MMKISTISIQNLGTIFQLSKAVRRTKPLPFLIQPCSQSNSPILGFVSYSVSISRKLCEAALDCVEGSAVDSDGVPIPDGSDDFNGRFVVGSEGDCDRFQDAERFFGVKFDREAGECRLTACQPGLRAIGVPYR